MPGLIVPYFPPGKQSLLAVVDNFYVMNSEDFSHMRALTRLILVGLMTLPVLLSAHPASANVSRLTLHRRNCAGVTAYVVYDSFSVGTAPYYAVFQADVNGNGVFGEAGEPTRYAKLVSDGGGQVLASARLNFKPQPEGTVIAVTAAEIDSAGNLVSGQLEPIRFECKNRPAFELLGGPEGIVIPPGLAVTATVNVERISVFSAPSGNAIVLAGLGRGQTVNVRGRNTRGDWVLIDFEGGSGWIMWQTQALLFGPYQSLPIITQP